MGWYWGTIHSSTKELDASSVFQFSGKSTIPRTGIPWALRKVRRKVRALQTLVLIQMMNTKEFRQVEGSRNAQLEEAGTRKSFMTRWSIWLRNTKRMSPTMTLLRSRKRFLEVIWFVEGLYCERNWNSEEARNIKDATQTGKAACYPMKARPENQAEPWRKRGSVHGKIADQWESPAQTQLQCAVKSYRRLHYCKNSARDSRAQQGNRQTLWRHYNVSMWQLRR